MEVYRQETQEIVNRFVRRRISLPECVALLGSAFKTLIPTLRLKDLPTLRVVMLANSQRVTEELECRQVHQDVRTERASMTN